jgi:hypothetical protein
LFDWGYRYFKETILSTVDNLAVDPNWLSGEVNARIPVIELLDAFWLKPTIPEIAAFADYPFEIGFGNDSRLIPLVEPYRVGETLTAIWTGRLTKLHPRMWDAGSMTRTPRIVRLLYFGAHRIAPKVALLRQCLVTIATLYRSIAAGQQRRLLITDFRLTLQLILLLISLRLMLCFASVRQIIDWITPMRSSERKDPDRMNKIAGLTDAILGKIRLLPHGNCLPRSLILYYFATRSGYSVRVHCGVRRVGTRLCGHAWVSMQGEPFFEASASTHSYVATFTSPESPAA